MQLQMQATVTGAKSFKGDIEGKHFDSTTLFVLMPVSERRGNAVGQNVAEMKFGTAEEYEKMKGLKFPVTAELGVLMTTTGPEIQSFKPIKQAGQ